ncbi:hypothetical protein CHUAL_008536 [Chamberlinius hualienensis]
METYTSAISPLLFIFRLFGIEFSHQTHCNFMAKIQNQLSKLLHLFTQVCLIVGFFLLSFSRKETLVQTLFFIASVVTVMQTVFSRLIIVVFISELKTIVKETEKMLKSFNGEEQTFLKYFKIVMKIMAFHQIYSIVIGAVFMIRNTDYYFFEVVGLSKNDMSVVTYYLHVITFGTSIKVASLWNGLVDVIIVTQLANLYAIFWLIGKQHSHVSSQQFVSYRNVLQFIAFHRKACKLVEMTNRVVRHLLFVIFMTKSFIPMFSMIEFMHVRAIYSLLTAQYSLWSLLTEIILASMVNRQVIKSLEKFHHFANEKCPAKMAKKLSVMLELYVVHVKVSQPGVDAVFLPTLSMRNVIQSTDFLLTYMLFVHKLKNRGDQNYKGYF